MGAYTSGVGTACRLEGKTCGACCWGPDLGREEVARRLRRHRDLAPRTIPGRPSRLRLLLHELLSRRGLDLLLAIPLWLPGIGPRLRTRFQRRAVCAFASFEDGSETRVGCLIHPEVRGGEDRRASAAFALFRGVGCGDPEYACPTARWYGSASPENRAAFRSAAEGLDWFAYGRAMMQRRS